MSTVGPSQDLLGLLHQWSSDPNKSLKIKKTSDGKIQILVKDATFFDWLFSFFRADGDKYSLLKEVLEGLPKDSNQQLKSIFNKIKSEHKAYSERSDSIYAMRLRNDLLEAYSVGVQKNLTERIQRSVAQPFQMLQVSKEKSILLVEYQSIETAVSELQKEASAGLLDKKALVNRLQQVLKIETVPMGKMLDLLYSHRFIGREKINRMITLLCDWKYGSENKVHDVRAQLRFFRSLHISPEVEINGQLYAFSEVFGFRLGESKTYNELFARPLTDEMRGQLLQKYHQVRQEVRDVVQDPSAQIICSNSFSRTRLHVVPKGAIQDRFSIVGKVLEATEANLVEATSEQSYAGRFGFSMAALLGQGADVQSREKSILDTLRTWVDSHDSLMVVQRLSPEDIHHFYHTAETSIVAPSQWCKELGLETSSPQAFSWNDPEKLTVDIQGSLHSSVSTKALRKEPEILAQNDRKIMLCRNNDGSYVIHAFVGATGVNNVAVQGHLGVSGAGEDLGSMQYGHEKAILEKPQVLSAQATAVVSERTLHIADRRGNLAKVDVTSSQTEFGMGSSTVISIYMARDYLPTPAVEQFMRKAVYQTVGTGKETVEIKTRLGDILATPVLYQTELFMADKQLFQYAPEICFTKFKEEVQKVPSRTSFCLDTWKTVLASVGTRSLEEAMIAENLSQDAKALLARLQGFLKKKYVTAESQVLQKT